MATSSEEIDMGETEITAEMMADISSLECRTDREPRIEQIIDAYITSSSTMTFALSKNLADSNLIMSHTRNTAPAAATAPSSPSNALACIGPPTKRPTALQRQALRGMSLARQHMDAPTIRGCAPDDKHGAVITMFVTKSAPVKNESQWSVSGVITNISCNPTYGETLPPGVTGETRVRLKSFKSVDKKLVELTEREISLYGSSRIELQCPGHATLRPFRDDRWKPVYPGQIYYFTVAHIKSVKKDDLWLSVIEMQPGTDPVVSEANFKDLVGRCNNPDTSLLYPPLTETNLLEQARQNTYISVHKKDGTMSRAINTPSPLVIRWAGHSPLDTRSGGFQFCRPASYQTVFPTDRKAGPTTKAMTKEEIAEMMSVTVTATVCTDELGLELDGEALMVSSQYDQDFKIYATDFRAALGIPDSLTAAHLLMDPKFHENLEMLVYLRGSISVQPLQLEQPVYDGQRGEENLTSTGPVPPFDGQAYWSGVSAAPTAQADGQTTLPTVAQPAATGTVGQAPTDKIAPSPKGSYGTSHIVTQAPPDMLMQMCVDKKAYAMRIPKIPDAVAESVVMQRYHAITRHPDGLIIPPHSEAVKINQHQAGIPSATATKLHASYVLKVSSPAVHGGRAACPTQPGMVYSLANTVFTPEYLAARHDLVYILLAINNQEWRESAPLHYVERASPLFAKSLNVLRGSYVIYAVHPYEIDREWLCEKRAPVPHSHPRQQMDPLLPSASVVANRLLTFGDDSVVNGKRPAESTDDEPSSKRTVPMDHYRTESP